MASVGPLFRPHGYLAPGRAITLMQTVLAFFRLIFNLGNIMSALSDLQGSAAALLVSVDQNTAKIQALRDAINTTIPSDEPALQQLKKDIDAAIAKIQAA